MSDVRASGMARLTKIQQEVTFARTRLLRKDLNRFEQSVIQAARVRNASSVGRQSGTFRLHDD